MLLPAGHSFPRELISVVWATCITETLVYPFVTTRIRIQNRLLDNESTSVLVNMAEIVKKGGFRSLYAGLSISYMRQIAYHGLRLGIQDQLVTHYGGEQKLTAVESEVIKTGTGLISLCAIQPTIVAKVRYQAGIYSVSLPLREAFKTIYRDEGLQGLYRGLGVNASRSIVIHLCDAICYSQIYNYVNLRTPLDFGFDKELLITALAGMMVVAVTNPIDVLRNRYINAPRGLYTNTYDCAVKIFKSQGWRSFYSGWRAYYFSVVTSNFIIYYIYEFSKDVLRSADVNFRK